MAMIITGIFMAIFGVANLIIGGRSPDRINAGFQRRLGWVGIGCGAFALLFGTLTVVFPVPTPLP